MLRRWTATVGPNAGILIGLNVLPEASFNSTVVSDTYEQTTFLTETACYIPEKTYLPPPVAETEHGARRLLNARNGEQICSRWLRARSRDRRFEN